MLGGIQPGQAASVHSRRCKGRAGDDGLLQRFGMLVWSDVVGEWRNVDRWPDTDAKNTARDIPLLDALAPVTDPESGKESPVFRYAELVIPTI